MKSIVGSRLNNSGMGKNRTRRKLKLCFLISAILSWAILVKFIYFQLCIRNEKLTLLVILGLPHILTLINIINKTFLLIFVCHFAACSGKL